MRLTNRRLLRSTIRIFSSVVFLAILSSPMVGFSQTGWDSTCDSVLQEPEYYFLSDVRRCAQRWESYMDVGSVSAEDAALYARGFSRLYHQGSASDRAMADTALNRLGQSPLPASSVPGSNLLEDFLAQDRPTLRVEEGNNRRARSHNEDGMDEYEDGDYRGAVEEFLDALDDDPFYALAKYNLVCQYALLGETEEAIFHLDELSRWDDYSVVSERMERAHSDSDLNSLRDDPRFRYITGYLETEVLNGAGDAGVEQATQIRDTLASIPIHIAGFGHDATIRSRPMIWYRTGFEDWADEAEQAMGVGDVTRMMISWDTDADLVVVWGDPESLADIPVERPVVQGVLRGTIESGDPEEALDDTGEGLEDAAGAAEDPEGAAGDFEEWMPGM